MPTQELSGTTALVTSASRGFGRTTAIAWFKDPAGNILEVLQERQREQRRSPGRSREAS